MSPEKHESLVNFIWGICNLLRGAYKRNEYRKVILPLTVLRRFDCLLAPTKEKVLKANASLEGKSEKVIDAKLRTITNRAFYNRSKLDFERLLDDQAHLASNLQGYINGFSPNIREIMERFEFGAQIAKMTDKRVLYKVIEDFKKIDLSEKEIDNHQMGYVFEELIRIGAEQANEEAGEHFTPREVIELMVQLLLAPDESLNKSHQIKTIYDPACGTGGMLTEAKRFIMEHNRKSNPILYGQDWNNDAWAVCKSDMFIKGEQEADENIILGDTFREDGHQYDKQGNKCTFDYMLANPPFGVEWKQQEDFIRQENENLGLDGRFGAGLPRINDGALLFLQHMLSKMRESKKGGSRIGIVFNGSPLFTGDAGSGESNIRKWIIENDWLEAIVALPDQLFYNTGISTYLWILTNRKEEHRKGKVQLIDGRTFFRKMRKSLGNKRNEISKEHIDKLVRIHGGFRRGEFCKIFDNQDFGYAKITVERPLRLNFQAAPERIERMKQETAFINLATSKKKGKKEREEDIRTGEQRQQQLVALVESLNPKKYYKDRQQFLDVLQEAVDEMEIRLTAAERKLILSGLSERDETAEICIDAKGNPEPDGTLRDTETVPLNKNIEIEPPDSLIRDKIPLKDHIDKYFQREVLPHVPDAWIDESKTSIGYEIPFTRHFYQYEPPRELDVIQKEIKELENEIVKLLKEVTS